MNYLKIYLKNKLISESVERYEMGDLFVDHNNENIPPHQLRPLPNPVDKLQIQYVYTFREGNWGWYPQIDRDGNYVYRRPTPYRPHNAPTPKPYHGVEGIPYHPVYNPYGPRPSIVPPSPFPRMPEPPNIDFNL